MEKNTSPKQEIRRRALMLRNKMPKEIQADKSIKICEKLYNHPCYTQSKTLLLYANTGSEVATDAICKKALADKKSVYYPKVSGKNEMDFYKVNSPSELFFGAFGIREPIGTFDKFDVDGRHCGVLILVPGVAFDILGNRIGYGKGFYDNFLSKLKLEGVTLVGLCFKSQVYESLPKDDFDMAMDFLIS